MTRIRLLDDDRIDHRQIGADRNPVVEESGVLHLTLVVVDVFLVEGPADTLRGPALELTFDIGRMNRLAGILQHRVAQDIDLAGLRIHLDIDDMGAEARRRPLRVDLRMACDRPAGLVGVLCDIGQGHRLEFARIRAGGLDEAALPGHGLGIDIPDHCRAGAGLTDDVLGSLNHGHAA